MESANNLPKRRSENRARERQIARQRRRLAKADSRPVPILNFRSNWMSRSSDEESGRLLRTMSWLFSSRQPLAKLTFFVALAVLIFFVGSYLFTGRIFPNVYALGIPVGNMTPAEAGEAILAQWQSDISIDFTVNGEIIRRVTPDELGMTVDVEAMANGARALGLSGIPFGTEVAPAVAVNYGRVQSLLLDMTELIYVLPYEAGYKWSGGKLVTVPGRQGRHLDVSASIDKLTSDPARVLIQRRFELPTIPLLADVMDSSPFIEEAHAFLSGGVRLNGYDPFVNQMISWQVDQKTAAEWLIAGANGVAVRRDAFAAFIKRLNQDLILGVPKRFIDELDAIEEMEDALTTNNSSIVMRIRLLPQPYEVALQDTGYRIGRKTGIPYQLIYEANPNVEWSALTIGQTIQIPSRDALLPERPVPHKRIIVDIESQWLVAFEHNRMVFSWAISSGRDTAPTYPGIFQIQQHKATAYGSSFALCNDAGTNCNQWKMSWFMGIYEVIPGLMNGFHGAVELPNGNYLGGGGVYEPSTFGCIMSLNDNAEQLFRWAESGTVVEIISNEFEPESDLGRFALEYISTIDTDYRPISA